MRYERFLQRGQPLRLLDLGELSVDVQTPLDQLDVTNRRRLLAQPLLELGTPPLQVGPVPCRHPRGPQRRQVGGDGVGFGSPVASFCWAICLTPRHRCPPVRSVRGSAGWPP
jgi:hypothetical protein